MPFVKKTITIGYDASRAFTSTSSGQVQRTGTENYSYQILVNLAKIDKKNQYVIYLRPNSVNPNTMNGWPSNFHFKVIPYKRLWTQIGLSRQTFIDNIDVLFVTAHTTPLIYRSGLKTVLTVHDLGSEYLPQTHQLKQRLYLGFMQRVQLRSADRIIAVSEATKSDIIDRMDVSNSKIKVVYEGYNESLYKELPIDSIIDSLKRYNLQPKNYFLFVGTVQPRKNLQRVITAFSFQLSAIRQQKEKSEDSRLKTDSLYLVIVGKKGWMADGIYALPKKLGIEDNVKFLDYVPDADLPAIYSGSLGLVFPSLFEGFGLPILEAQACGTPVITSNVSSMPEVAGEGALLVDPYNTDEITAAMIKIQDPTLRTLLIKKGFENIKRFSWERAAWDTLKVIEEAVG